MVALADIELTLAGRPVADSAELNTFREIAAAIRLYKYPINQLGTLLTILEQLLPLAAGFDTENSNVWARWSSTTSTILAVLNSPNAPPSKVLTAMEIRQHAKRYPFAACLLASQASLQRPSLFLATAILLVGHYRFYHAKSSLHQIWLKYHNSGIDVASDQLLSCHIIKSSVFMPIARDMLPNLISHTFLEWKTLFLEHSYTTPSDQSYKSDYRYVPDQFVFIRTLSRILEEVSPSNEAISLPKEGKAPSNSSTPDASVIFASPEHNEAKHTQSSVSYFHKPFPTVDFHVDGLAPTAVRFIPQVATPPDQTPLIPAVQSLNVRYSNYRSAMDNQRLPWSWDCLNKFEVTAVTESLQEANSLNAGLEDKQGAFLVWLLLATGQSLDTLLQFSLERPGLHGTLVGGYIYCRSIYTPPQSFQPRGTQQALLAQHTNFIELARLPSPPVLARELAFSNKNRVAGNFQTIAAYLNIDSVQADLRVRTFLSKYRTRNLRLLPGKIRNTLSNEIMRISSDPILTHLLTALPTDMPPSGVYYTAYSTETLKQIYQEALNSIWSTDE